MHSSSLILFAIVALIALNSVRTSAKPVKTTAAASTTTLAAPAPSPAAKPAAPGKKTPAKKGSVERIASVFSYVELFSRLGRRVEALPGKIPMLSRRNSSTM